MNTLLWVVLPYVVLAIFVFGHLWRYRYDQFGWTTRSSELYERRLLRIGSPLFHVGILFVLLGHVAGLVVPQRWTQWLGVSETGYHWAAIVLGTLAGVCTLGGLALLIYRRRTVGPVFMATTRNDKLMYLLLAVTLLLGLGTTVISNVLGEYDYRRTVSPWFRSIFLLHPEGDLMAGAPPTFHLHVLAAFALFAVWPFTRLVHMLTAPLGYLTRPYIVYRSRAGAPGDPARARPPAADARRGF
ncbi:respiratory nitrate reductase subunit gamma [Bailinhaonella thermotolerans]|uniref:Nitrate reductase-like protein NarX n=1 Tax=Bailinhaonella thermotolerans TaxID=1070861 RepID=A0A3A4AK72_9ACTN|nr:respiratory nitrate reductase subunit gamma [Bailinhaonella thermotolerans]RJL30046.1 respiratory nitrate reductase subunit gamma [Bailinhaonella thermotolerans]